MQFNSAQPQSAPKQTQQANMSYNFNSSGGQLENHKIKCQSGFCNAKSGLVKVLLLIFIPLGIITGAFLYITSGNQETTYRQAKDVVLVVPMKNVNWQDLGNVFEPIVELPIKTPSGYQNWEFLLDSGAVVSSLPREWAEKTGQDLAMMKRSTFRGFGGKTSFAYQGDMMVLMGDEDREIPVVFTESAGTKSLLGRKGFFENYSVYFNHKEQQIEIRE